MRESHAEFAAKFYDRIIRLHHQEFNYRKLQYRDWLDIMASRLGRGAVVLDLGCGNGRAVKYLVDKGFQGIGVDVSDKMLELAKKHVPRGKYYRKDFTKLEFKPNSFDAVVSFFALNHIPKEQFKEVMVSCKRFLKKGGLLLLGMVKGGSDGLFEGFYGKKMPLYGAGYTKKELIDILKSNGYDILKTGIEHFKGKYFEEDDIYILAKIKK